MELFKQIIELIITGASRVDVDIIVALLIFYIVMVPAFFMIRIIRGVHK